MKKILIISIIFVVILLVAIVGSILVSPKEEIATVEDILSMQKTLDASYECYGYTIDNPRIVVNPYENSFLSALVMFETKEEEQVEVYLFEDDSRYLLYKEEGKTRNHYLDIYNLKIGDNRVLLKVDDEEYIYTIVTDNIEVNIPQVDVLDNQIYFTTIDSALVGINSKKEVVYYFTGFTNNVLQLENGHLLVTTNRVNNDGSYISFTEIDMLGRIYNDYVVESGCYGLVWPLESGNYLVLSDDILEIDRQNGKVLGRYDVSEEDRWLSLSYENGQIILKGMENIMYYDYGSSNKKVVNQKSVELENKIQINYGNYYRKYEQNRFGKNKETTVDDVGVNLFFYKDRDDVYDDYKIEFNKEYDRVSVSKKKDGVIYIIFDKFGERLVYEMKDSEFYINSVNLSGKYNIYVRIDEKNYKTGYYVEM